MLPLREVGAEMSGFVIPEREGMRPVAALIVYIDERNLTVPAFTHAPFITDGVAAETIRISALSATQRFPMTDDDRAYMAFSEAGAIALTTDDPEDGE